MRFAAAAVVAAFAGLAAAHSNATAYVTEVVTSYTTYCPEATQVTHNGVTYTVSEPSTLTITNCPCTIVKPVTSSVVSSCSTCSVSAAPYPSPNGTAPVYASGTGSTGWSPSVTGYSSSSGLLTPSSSSSAEVSASPSSTAGPITNAGVSVQVAGFLAGAGALAALLM